MRNLNKVVSATLCVSFTQDPCPESFDDAIAFFGQFGDVACIDLSLAWCTRRVQVTFYDLRVADSVLARLRGQAVKLPDPPQICRRVGAKIVDLTGVGPTIHDFGEVADLDFRGDYIIVEYYDMRSCKRAFSTVPGARLWWPQPTSGNSSDGPSSRTSTTTTGPATTTTTSSGTSSSPRSDEHDSPGVRRGSVRSVQNETATGTGGGTDQGDNNRANGTGGTSESARDSSPTIEVQLEIGSEAHPQIRVKNLPATLTPETFQKVLDSSDLAGKYVSLRMPFDEVSDRYAGFAFVTLSDLTYIASLHKVLHGFLGKKRQQIGC